MALVQPTRQKDITMKTKEPVTVWVLTAMRDGDLTSQDVMIDRQHARSEWWQLVATLDGEGYTLDTDFAIGNGVVENNFVGSIDNKAHARYTHSWLPPVEFWLMYRGVFQ